MRSMRPSRPVGWLIALVAAALLVLCARPADAAERLKVYIKPVEPFVFEQNGRPFGYSIDLWERVAHEAGVEYDLVPVDSVSDMVAALKDNKADVGVGALSITADREAVIDFSHAFYKSGLQILVGAPESSSMVATIRGFLTWDLLKTLAVLALALIATSHLLWAFERKKNPESFPASYRKGVWESLWWTVSTIITGGCENKAPIGVAGRLVAVVWMLAGILLVSYITASVTAVLTVNQLTSEIGGPGDLPGKLVATVKGSTAEKFLTDQHVDVRAYPAIDDAYAALSKGDVKAVVYDAPVLLYHVNSSGSTRLRVVGHVFEKQSYGFGLQQNSKYRKPINEAMLKLQENGFFDELQKKWFGVAD